jgi:hypothetical protein
VGSASRSRASHFSDRRLIATAGNHFEHKSCAVKFHAYTLDSSGNLASALQQNKPFPQLLGITLFSRSGMIEAVRRRTNAPVVNVQPYAIEPYAET